ncbi:MAG TPA: bifunctional 5,10-methylenetetrahydrofolate dehydrogenase/5,10-methenyltetrahydrofolate cyclohydrolase [Candidatus Limnocylindrales bacterium]|nr:bifunctional 5,10-methylenetetrahydrofolate dehydrogenase/5,10-methenyltetrahydrofolate cyclohydrolase [Candidatus Limnocylindrales bacterium]
MTAVDTPEDTVTEGPVRPREVSASGRARLLEGRPLAAEIRAQVAVDVADIVARFGRPPALAVVFVGDDAPSAVYLERIIHGCETVGASTRTVGLPADTDGPALGQAVRRLSRDPAVDGIIVQMPLPAGLPLRAIIDAIDPDKDVDGLHPIHAGRLALGYEGFLPATAQAAVEILKRSGYDLEGLSATVVGRSNVVGRPAALLLLREHCTVTICHSRTRDLAASTRAADIVVVAAGRPGLITGAMLKPGALVVDVGINVTPEGIVGDVDFASASQVAAAITPVPGGVGPLTGAILLEHLVTAARRHLTRA